VDDFFPHLQLKQNNMVFEACRFLPNLINSIHLEFDFAIVSKNRKNKKVTRIQQKTGFFAEFGP
jgi:hypothetical protein